MYFKKRNYTSKKAQITIFIILGIILLFIFLWLMMLASRIKTTQLSGEEEEVIGRIFEPEALNQFVKECLTTSLGEGLKILSDHGTIWDTDGGITKFTDEETGTLYDGNKIFYGITKEHYSVGKENTYPCDDEDQPCNYKFPKEEGFGKLTIHTLESDLQNYMKKEVVECTETWLGFSTGGQEILSEDMELSINLGDNVIQVFVDYPMTFTVGGEEFFHLQKFDFTFDTKIKQLIEAAVTIPFLWDQSYVDYDYIGSFGSAEFTFTSPEPIPGILCTYRSEGEYSCKGSTLKSKLDSLGIGELTHIPIPNGDDIFIFTSERETLGEGLTEYLKFTIARQNRPPALDPVERFACLTEDELDVDYDYLVIKGDENYGSINPTLSAHDPDDNDLIDYSITSDGIPIYGDNPFDSGPVEVEQGIYSFTATATDEHSESDSQNVKVLVDRPIEPSTSMHLTVHYIELNYYKENEPLYRNDYFISREDPVVLRMSFPEESSATNLEVTPSITYYPSSGGDLSYSYEFPSALAGDICFQFPYLGENCDALKPDNELIDIYNGNDLERISAYTNFETTPYHLFMQNLQGEPPELVGKIDFAYEVNYCGYEETSALSSLDTVNVILKECSPHKNPNNPWAYPYNKYEYDINPDGTKTLVTENSDINPFLAEHSCCTGNPDRPGNWRYKDAGEICFKSGPNCKGEIDQYTELSGYKGYVLEEQVDFCSGERGNICGSGSNPSSTYKSELIKNNEGIKELRCGSSDSSSQYYGLNCNKAASDCQGQLAWSYVDTNEDLINDAWCHNNMGCENICTSTVVDTLSKTTPGVKFYPNSDINLNSPPATDSELGFVCGCDPRKTPSRAKCDSNFDGKFNGVCSTNSCINDYP